MVRWEHGPIMVLHVSQIDRNDSAEDQFDVLFTTVLMNGLLASSYAVHSPLSRALQAQNIA